MNSIEGSGDSTRTGENRARNAEMLGEAARRLPQVVKEVDRLQAAWAVLMSPRTPRWKRVVVALEVARLMIVNRLRKPAPVAVEEQATDRPDSPPHERA